MFQRKQRASVPDASAAGPKYYRMLPELRRSAVYVMVSVPLLAIVFMCVEHAAPQKGPIDHAITYAIFTLITLAMAFPLRWALRLDDRSIARRRLFRWDVWDWEDFATGRIQKRYPFTLYDPDRPWGRRSLRFGYIPKAEFEYVLGRVNAHYRLPPPPEVRDSMQIKWGFRRSARFDSNGIHLLVRGRRYEYLWSEIKRVRITRPEPKRRDFACLRVVLPGQEISLKLISHQGGVSPSWRGATAEQINEVLLRNAPAEVVDVDMAGKRPARRVDAEDMLEKALRDLRQLRIVLSVCSILLLATLVWMAIDDGLLKAIFLGSMYLVLLLSAACYVLGQLRCQVSTAEKFLLGFDEEDTTSRTTND